MQIFLAFLLVNSQLILQFRLPYCLGRRLEFHSKPKNKAKPWCPLVLPTIEGEISSEEVNWQLVRDLKWWRGSWPTRINGRHRNKKDLLGSCACLGRTSLLLRDGKGFSKEVIEIMLHSKRSATECIYNHTCQIFQRWAATRGIDTPRLSYKDIVSFLFEEWKKGLKASTLNS